MTQGTNPELREPESVREPELAGDFVFIFQGCSLHKNSSEQKAARTSAHKPSGTPETRGERSPNKTFLHTSFCEHIFKFPLDKILRAESLCRKMFV